MIINYFLGLLVRRVINERLLDLYFENHCNVKAELKLMNLTK